MGWNLLFSSLKIYVDFKVGHSNLKRGDWTHLRQILFSPHLFHSPYPKFRIKKANFFPHPLEFFRRCSYKIEKVSRFQFFVFFLPDRGFLGQMPVPS
jgi:hypothetical protein